MGSNFHRRKFLGSLGLIASSRLPAAALLKTFEQHDLAALSVRNSPSEVEAATPRDKIRLRLQVVSTLVDPVIDQANPDTHDIPGGFETGNTLKLTIHGRTGYHMVATTMETTGSSKWTHQRMEHWVSADSLHWRRERVLYRPHVDPATGLWILTSSQFPYFDQTRNRWVIYFNYQALNGIRNWTLPTLLMMAEAKTGGLEGINGDFDLPGIDVARSGYAHPTDAESSSLSPPFQVADGRYMAFLGFSVLKEPHWYAALVSAPGPRGPFKFEAEYWPLPIMSPPGYVENPLPMKLRGPKTGRDYWAIIFDYLRPEVTEGHNSTIGFSYSYDGLNWPQENGQIVDVNDGLAPGKQGWWRIIRTPHQLIDEGDGTYTCFFTGLYRNDFFAVGMMKLKLVEEEA
jgi:hypothetical protein